MACNKNQKAMPGGTAFWLMQARWNCHFHIAPLPVALLEGEPAADFPVLGLQFSSKHQSTPIQGVEEYFFPYL
jgi:hypothetical protein